MNEAVIHRVPINRQALLLGATSIREGMPMHACDAYGDSLAKLKLNDWA